MTLCAICAPETPSSNPYVVDLAVADLRFRVERIKHLRRIIRLSRYIPLLLYLVGYRSDPEFVNIERCGLPVVSHFCLKLQFIDFSGAEMTKSFRSD